MSFIPITSNHIYEIVLDVDSWIFGALSLLTLVVMDTFNLIQDPNSSIVRDV